MILTIELSVAEAKQPIFRTIEVGSGISFQIFHEIIQMLFGWSNAHAHFFNDKSENRIVDENEVIGDFFSKNASIDYFYDFSNSWHIRCLLIDKKTGSDLSLPICIEGNYNSPPEDSGGIVGYDTALEYIEKHRQGKRLYPLIAEEYGDDFDPFYFNIERVNKQLMNIVL